MPDADPGITRRRFLASATALGAAALWTPVFRISPASAQATCPPPRGFPGGIELFQQCFSNWTGDIRVDDLWTCEPRTPEDVVRLTNWARRRGYTLRARGFSHNWSPIHVTSDTTACSRVVMVDMTAHLHDMRISSHGPPSVTVQAGAAMEDLLGFLESFGYGVTSCPAPGGLSVGGVLAIGGHGDGIPARDEQRKTGQTYGSLSNRVLSLTAVVWDPRARCYALRTFARSHPHMRALLVSLGRTIVIEVELQVEVNHNLRCESFVDIPARDLFAAPGASENALERFLEESGRIEAIWFPFTEIPWLKVWSVAEQKPIGATEVAGPYNYAFTDVPAGVSESLIQTFDQTPEVIESFSTLFYFGVTQQALTANDGELLDLWGASKDLLLFVRPGTLPSGAGGWVILTRRRDVQQVVHDLAERFESQLDAHRERGSFPINGPIEMRVTGLDQRSEVEARTVQEPSLSPLVPRWDRPEWDSAVWVSVLSLPRPEQGNGVDCPVRGTMRAETTAFYADWERWMLERFTGDYAMVRPEWSKGWAYGSRGPWTDPRALRRVVPALLERGRPAHRGWNDAVLRLAALDPWRVFTNPFLDSLLRRRPRARRARRRWRWRRPWRSH